jgi:hypothetical protein
MLRSFARSLGSVPDGASHGVTGEGTFVCAGPTEAATSRAAVVSARLCRLGVVASPFGHLGAPREHERAETLQLVEGGARVAVG